jgi:hypothetical protein
MADELNEFFAEEECRMSIAGSPESGCGAVGTRRSAKGEITAGVGCQRNSATGIVDLHVLAIQARGERTAGVVIETGRATEASCRKIHEWKWPYDLRTGSGGVGVDPSGRLCLSVLADIAKFQ